MKGVQELDAPSMVQWCAPVARDALLWRKAGGLAPRLARRNVGIYKCFIWLAWDLLEVVMEVDVARRLA
ncbi:hypothetical protein [Halomonas litopenaei]|uniref:hypothetical protein n=1 Tax=Halomonas litopenaei TaxID=2109328 RepID=UPI003FA09B94